MPRRHPPIPTIWLMTDERMGDGLLTALERLPRGAGVVLRHYGLETETRHALTLKVAKAARRKGLILVVAEKNRGTRGAGVHNGRRNSLTPFKTAAAHSRREAIAAMRGGADAVFVSPVFATRSHPGAKALGPVRFGLMVQGLRIPAIALGGMTPKRARHMRALGASGWAAIDAWLDPIRRSPGGIG